MRYVDVRGARLAVREQGAGPAFVWAHALLSSMAQEDTAGVFDFSSVAATHRLVRFDARGHGESTAGGPPEGGGAAGGPSQSWPELARDLLGLLDALGIERAVLGGASMGCATVVHAAVQAPERVAGLVLAIPPTAGEGRRVQATVYRGLALLDRTRLLDGVRLAVRPLPRPSAAPGTRRALGFTALDTLLRDRRRVAPLLCGAASSDLPPDDELARLTMPALILAWPDDPVHPLATARRLHDLLPDSTLEVASDDAAFAAWPARVAGFLAGLAG